ncbi:MAG: hypothetical protein OXF43_02655 [Gammaproteobacteria bacterium]|nr:hypothetical protein [Gammaproteobacteria bacterium]
MVPLLQLLAFGAQIALSRLERAVFLAQGAAQFDQRVDFAMQRFNSVIVHSTGIRLDSIREYRAAREAGQ